MAQLVIFWIVFGVAGFGLALALQMRVMVAKVLAISVAAQYPQVHHKDVRAVVRASPLDKLPAGFPAQLDGMCDWVRKMHPGAVRHLALARRWSVVLPALLLVIVAFGRFKLGVF